MRVEDLDYELPGDLIAQEPTTERTAARLLAEFLAQDRILGEGGADCSLALGLGPAVLAWRIGAGVERGEGKEGV